MDTAIRGAELVDVSDRIARVVRMTTPKHEVPIIAYTGFKRVRGLTGTKSYDAGGIYDRVELDCSIGKGTLRRVKVALDKKWIKQNQWGAVEEAIELAGQALMSELIKSVCDKYTTDVDSAMTGTLSAWGGADAAKDHYTSLLTAVSKIEAQEMSATVIIIHPDEIPDVFSEQYFINVNYSRVARGEPVVARGNISDLMRIPIIATPQTSSGSMIAAAHEKAMIVGVYGELTVENFDLIIEGEEGAVISMDWDVKSGKDAKVTKPTAKAWAVVTGA